IWFKWTAPANGAYTFNTFGSVIADSTLGIYTGNSVDNLTAIAQNDDADPANGVLLSSLTFIANAQTTYYIAVDSFDASAETGDISSNWPPQQIFAGDFIFTSPLYLISYRETSPRIDGRMSDADSIYHPAKVPVTRRLCY